MTAFSKDELIESWLLEEEQPFVGWDFSYIEGRMSEGREHWSYLERAADLMRCSSSVVDMDTGGGEKLLSLREHWPARVVATEDYPPNFELAAERLSLFGVTVVRAAVSDIAPMPFGDSEFDLVLNRHAAFNASEVARVLSEGGALSDSAGARNVGLGPAGRLRRGSPMAGLDPGEVRAQAGGGGSDDADGRQLGGPPGVRRRGRNRLLS